MNKVIIILLIIVIGLLSFLIYLNLNPDRSDSYKRIEHEDFNKDNNNTIKPVLSYRIISPVRNSTASIIELQTADSLYSYDDIPPSRIAIIAAMLKHKNVFYSLRTKSLIVADSVEVTNP